MNEIFLKNLLGDQRIPELKAKCYKTASLYIQNIWTSITKGIVGVQWGRCWPK